MKYVYYCPNCNILGSVDKETPEDYQACKQCDFSMIYTGITRDEWEQKTREEKDALKDKFRSELFQGSSIVDHTVVHILTDMNKSIFTIKMILIVEALLVVLLLLFSIMA